MVPHSSKQVALCLSEYTGEVGTDAQLLALGPSVKVAYPETLNAWLSLLQPSWMALRS